RGDLRRPDRQPAPDHLHHACGLPRLRPAGGAAQAPDRRGRGRAAGAARARPWARRPGAGAGGMNLSAPFIRRPIATILLTIGLALAGIAGFSVLPVAPLPMVDFPAVSVQASLPGGSPQTMATSAATPLDRRLGT